MCNFSKNALFHRYRFIDIYKRSFNMQRNLSCIHDSLHRDNIILLLYYTTSMIRYRVGLFTSQIKNDSKAFSIRFVKHETYSLVWNQHFKEFNNDLSSQLDVLFSTRVSNNFWGNLYFSKYMILQIKNSIDLLCPDLDKKEERKTDNFQF